MDHSSNFIKALINSDIPQIRSIPKSDLYNHFVLGGDRAHIYTKTGYKVRPLSHAIHSMNEMHIWSSYNIGERFNSTDMRKLLIEATFIQARKDGVTVLEIGEDVWGLAEYFHQNVDELISAFVDIKNRIAPSIELRLQIGMSRHCSINYLLNCLEPFWDRKEFYSIDLYGDEFAQPIENFIPIYKKAKMMGLKCKAHIGEFGTAVDVIKGIELLSLDEVQHGIAVAESKEAMEFVRQNKIRLNITPTSNVMLSRVPSIAEHPIGKLYRYGIDVTINSDDILIFDSDVSKEYVTLYQNDVLSAEELNDIRVKGLQ